ncbi:hypothetical protein JCM10213_002079 [Rhodosporidiobolus nylandii]
MAERRARRVSFSALPGGPAFSSSYPSDPAEELYNLLKLSSLTPSERLYYRHPLSFLWRRVKAAEGAGGMRAQVELVSCPDGPNAGADEGWTGGSFESEHRAGELEAWLNDGFREWLIRTCLRYNSQAGVDGWQECGKLVNALDNEQNAFFFAEILAMADNWLVLLPFRRFFPSWRTLLERWSSSAPSRPTSFVASIQTAFTLSLVEHVLKQHGHSGAVRRLSQPKTTAVAAWLARTAPDACRIWRFTFEQEGLRRFLAMGGTDMREWDEFAREVGEQVRHMVRGRKERWTLSKKEEETRGQPPARTAWSVASPAEFAAVDFLRVTADGVGPNHFLFPEHLPPLPSSASSSAAAANVFFPGRRSQGR